MKQWFTLKNALSLILFLLLGIKLWPQVHQNFSSEGEWIRPRQVKVLSDHSPHNMREIPPQNERILILFWASWCGPCKIEMDRFHQSVSDKKIDGGRIIAINPFEDTQVVRKFLKEKFYPFTFVEAPMLTQELDVSVTPTTLLIENGKIISRSSGISVIGIWRAENFLSL